MFNFRKFIVLLFILVIISGCVKLEPPRKPIKLALSIWPGYAHAFIAQKEGFFKQNGVEVELIFKKEYNDALQLYKDGAVDGLFEVFTDAIYHNSQGLPTKVVYVTDYSNKGDVIVARPEINSLLDLKEKPVGIDGINSFSHLFVLSCLTKAGLKEEDLRFEIVPAQEVPQALDEGKIIAGHTWEPSRSLALKKGYKIIARAGDIPGIITDVLVFNISITEKRPDAVRAIIKALFQAQDFVKNNRAQAIAIMAKAEGMTLEEMDQGLKDIVQPNLAQNELIMSKSYKENDLFPCLFETGKMIYDFYGKRGRYFSEKDLEEIIDPSFLK